MRIETTQIGGGGDGNRSRSRSADGSVIALWRNERETRAPCKESPLRPLAPSEDTPSPHASDNPVSVNAEIEAKAAEARKRHRQARLVRREAVLSRSLNQVEASGLTHWSVPRPTASPTVYASATPAAVRWDAVRK